METTTVEAVLAEMEARARIQVPLARAEIEKGQMMVPYLDVIEIQSACLTLVAALRVAIEYATDVTDGHEEECIAKVLAILRGSPPDRGEEGGAS